MVESPFDMKPRMCFEIEKVIGISSDGNVRSYQVQWAPAWVNSFHLVGCEHLIHEFLNKQVELRDETTAQQKQQQQQPQQQQQQQQLQHQQQQQQKQQSTRQGQDTSQNPQQDTNQGTRDSQYRGNVKKPNKHGEPNNVQLSHSQNKLDSLQDDNQSHTYNGQSNPVDNPPLNDDNSSLLGEYSVFTADGCVKVEFKDLSSSLDAPVIKIEDEPGDAPLEFPSPSTSQNNYNNNNNNASFPLNNSQFRHYTEAQKNNPTVLTTKTHNSSSQAPKVSYVFFFI